jgi:peptidyl-tRNA hydrolase
MKNTHIIQKQIFKIKIGDQKKFKEVCQIIEGLFKNELGAYIEEVLDQYNIKDQDIVIDRLDIDLGKLDTRNLKNSIKSTFISSFQRILEEKIKLLESELKIKQHIIDRHIDKKKTDIDAHLEKYIQSDPSDSNA